MKEKSIVIKIGGSLLFDMNHNINAQKISDFCDIVKKHPNYDKIIIVVGGGIIAREYIQIVRSFTQNEALCDTFGIDISRINARLLISYLGSSAYPLVPKSIEELSIANLQNRIVLMGGLQPGQSTTSVALEVAEYIAAPKLIILTDVGGIYNKDPKKFDDARLIEHINSADLTKLIIKRKNNLQAAAGEYRIFDTVSLQIIKRSNISVFITSGLNLEKFKRFWNQGDENIGTIVSDKK
ncbi:MAG: UMP kinase [Candidatus Lokiarchaeota archaeon]|nr:UMP kinase [Candidatus Lokiarchaeota archaeon]MBD3201026.1 UMP kinase [Candidatus Lokiarchaeota archaeon]